MKDRSLNMERPIPFLLIGLTTILSLFILYTLNFVTEHDIDQELLLIKPHKKEEDRCDLFNGSWVPDFKGSMYTNSSCATISTSKNCFRHGRKDRDFLNWRWKPEKCDLPRFDAKAYLDIVRGKTLAFIGDSVARNHIESLLCLLSQEEVPVDAYLDSEDRNRVWHFPVHNFTLKMLWTKFLVSGEERVINGSSSGIFDLYLDKVDENWARELHGLDYVILSDAHWFFRQIYLHRGSNVVACVYCNVANVTDEGVVFALRMAFRAALSHINQCEKCEGIVTLLRTFSPSHFENGSWNTGGSCSRTSPYSEMEIDFGGYEWEIRRMQVEETERAKRKGKSFGVLDVTMAMLMRPDGHPGAFWGNQWMKGYNDCVHWCLPGPIDVWNDLLLALLRRLPVRA
ncbi:PROTEIN TRICHOME BIREFRINGENCE-LIKE 9-RELATED [Salix purpurea]|uniref:PROTEIN TRICHOME BIREFRINGENCE-LIKE 9-RELATED n=1 Tax=Salix purpurea TaxID=77065 RepID=A0A9Q0ZN73_SALPP|nr:PROTEIN TRICHOME BIREFRINGENCE-LIKE 9-RELATED [Salix purpurea]